MRAVSNIFTVNKPFLILVEGVSDKAMLAEYIRAVDLELPSYQIIPYNGKDAFKSVWKNIATQPKFNNVTALAVFRDADDNIEGAFQSVQHHLKNGYIPETAVPNEALEVKIDPESGLKTGVFITPDGESEGALETLLLKSLSEDMRNHVKDYVTNAEALIHPTSHVDYKNSTKSHCYAYTSLHEMENFRDSFRKHAWDWEHEAFTPLKIFLELFEQ